MAWLYLVLAGIFEIGWPLGFKLASTSNYKLAYILGAGACMAFSGVLLYLAQKQIPIGTAYAVWTGIGGAGTFIVGVLFFNDAITLLRVLGVALIVGGVVVLKIGS